MLAGETPFAAPTAQAMIARRFTETVRPIRQVREAVPEGVERALQRALAANPRRSVRDRRGVRRRAGDGNHMEATAAVSSPTRAVLTLPALAARRWRRWH